MTEPYIIEEIEKIRKKKEEEPRPTIQIPPPPQKIPPKEEDGEIKRGVVIIQV